LVPTIVPRRVECLCYRSGDCKLGVGVFFGLRDVLHGVVHDGERADLREQILTIVVGMYDQGEPQIMVVDPLMISLLKYDPGGFVKGHVRDQRSREAEATFLSFSVFKTCWIVVFAVHLSGRHNVEYVQLHRFFKWWMIGR